MSKQTKNQNKTKTGWFASGQPWIWFNAGAVSLSLALVFGVIAIIAVKALSHFWQADLYHLTVLEEGITKQYLGEIIEKERVPAIQLKEAGHKIKGSEPQIERILFKRGNRDTEGQDFLQIISPNIQKQNKPKLAVVVERYEWGNFYGFVDAIEKKGKVKKVDVLGEKLKETMDWSNNLIKEIAGLKKHDLGSVNYKIEKLRLDEKRLKLKNKLTKGNKTKLDEKLKELDIEYRVVLKNIRKLESELEHVKIHFSDINGNKSIQLINKIVKITVPNSLTILGKIQFYINQIWAFLSEDPREANTEGGIFPALFGTLLMVLLMTVLVTPMGVISAVYLREYAKQNWFTQLIRISVNNLAGVPSIVYGVFGLGFFVYFLGGSIDDLFYPEAKPAPMFGTPGLIWASLTLALLTLPVVIVTTEEGLARVPLAVREGSLALGATKAETLWRTVLPMASPSIITGVILAIARAAGEVAPLMLVGVVKLAPSLPLDGNFPFLHLERKFMHLGFHIYDVGFQSPNVEAARPLVYATALLLIIVVIVLNFAAIVIRNRLRERYKSLEH